MKNSMYAIVIGLLGSITLLCSAGETPFVFSTKVGVAPAFYSYRGITAAAVFFPTSSGRGGTSFVSPLTFKAADGQKYSQMWHNIPLLVTGELAYELHSSCEFFGEFNYMHAWSRNQEIIGISPLGGFGTLKPRLDDFNAYGAYIGSRFFAPFFNRAHTAFFAGFKMGLLAYSKVKATPFTIESIDGVFTKDVIWFEADCVPSGGIQTGIEVAYADSFSFFLTAELVASGAMRPTFNVVNTTQVFLNFTNLLREAPGSLITIPLSVGLRYSF